MVKIFSYFPLKSLENFHSCKYHIQRKHYNAIQIQFKVLQNVEHAIYIFIKLDEIFSLPVLYTLIYFK